MTISRRTLRLGLGLILVLIVCGVWPERSGRLANLPPTARGPWVAFGDSLTEGYGASFGADYPTQLGRLLNVRIQNFGGAGDTSGDGLKRLAEVEALEPRVVLLCFGGNDVLQGLAAEQMFANISTMIDRLQARGSFVVLIGIRGPGLLGDKNAKAFKHLAREKAVLHMSNILDGLLSEPRLMSDYVHPNDAGYEKIAARLEGLMRRHMKQLSPMGAAADSSSAAAK